MSEVNQTVEPMIRYGFVPRYFAVPQVPDAAQMKDAGHTQVKLGGGYVSLTLELYNLKSEDRAKVKLAMLQAQAGGKGQQSYRPESKAAGYIPLELTGRGEGSAVVDLSIGGVVIASLVVDPGVVLTESPLPVWGPKDGEGETDEAEEGEGEGDDDPTDD